MTKEWTSPASTKTPGALLRTLLARLDIRHSLVMFATMSLSNVLDYAFNVIVGRLLTAEGYGILIALQAMLRIVAVSLEIVRTVIARYTVQFLTRAQRTQLGAFLRTAFRQTFLLGIAASLLIAALARPLARALQIESLGPVLAAAASLLPLMVKPVIDGALQGAQRFERLGLLQAAHAAFRLAVGLLLVRLGLDALGAVAALPIGTVGTLLLGIAMLGGMLGQRADRLAPRAPLLLSGLRQYAGKTAIGVIAFAVLVNMDALLVKVYAPPLQAGHYSLAVTLGKIVLFLPAAFAQVLFPKSAERHLLARNSTRLLRLSQVLTVLPCAALTVAYFVLPGPILRIVFGVQNPFAGPVLGLIALAMSGYALTYVWMNYYLSVQRAGYVYALLVGALVQLALLALCHATLTQMAAMVAATSLGLVLFAELWYWLGARTGQGRSTLPDDVGPET
ncbi:MAG: oligosaccharide flippase family protein [Anaerolineae bacterium]|nr:oligosaccharide flippase family protein [Anaerolineae bacterium]